jgi:hypothetical protein
MRVVCKPRHRAVSVALVAILGVVVQACGGVPNADQKQHSPSQQEAAMEQQSIVGRWTVQDAAGYYEFMDDGMLVADAGGVTLHFRYTLTNDNRQLELLSPTTNKSLVVYAVRINGDTMTWQAQGDDAPTLLMRVAAGGGH